MAATEVQKKGGSALDHAGIDSHERYSVVSLQDAQGQIVQEQRGDHQFPEVFQRLFRECREPVALVYESTINWGWLYEIVEPAENVASITRAHPFKVRLIAEAEIETDKISARALATLLAQRMTGLHFWAMGYCLSTVGLDEQRIHQHIKEPE